MRRLFALSIVWLAVHIAVADAIPARLPYMPEDPAKAPPPISILANTIWRGRLYDENSRIAFLPDGKLTYGEPGGTSPGTWKLEGNQLFFQINDYSEYKTVLLGDVIQGEGVNKAGQKCQPLLKRAAN